MSEETKKILEMVAEGRISTDDAERLLNKLNAGAARSNIEETLDAQNSKAQTPRFLRIAVDSPDRDQVNVRVPLAFLRSGIGLMGVLPPRVAERLADKGLDLSHLAGLKGQELIDALRALDVDIEAGDGKKVRICCE
jgi:SHOCT-like domain